MSDGNLWERQSGETAKAYAAFLLYRDLPAIDRSVPAARERHQSNTKGTLRQWKGWSMRNGWVNRAAEHDSDLASRRREHTAKEMERSQDDALILIRAALAKVAERIQGMDAKELAAGQIPAALRTLIELERQVLGYEDRVALTGKDGGPVKTQHIFQPTQEVWDEVVRERVEFERKRAETRGYEMATQTKLNCIQ